MCKWGSDVEIDDLLTVDGHRRTWKIDACIAPIVKALNDGGIDTLASCCGHGKGPGRIDLSDGRVLMLAAVQTADVEALRGALAHIEQRTANMSHWWLVLAAAREYAHLAGVP